MEEEKKKDNRKLIGIIAATVVIVLLIVGGLFLILRDNSSDSSVGTETEEIASTISGSLDINGVLPEGSVLSLVSSEVETGTTPIEFDSIVDPEDQDNWLYTNATSGETYTIQGILKSANGDELAKSNKITVSAPASNEVITINVIGKDLTGEAVVSGVIKVNGHYPEGSTVTTAIRTPNTEFTESREGLPAQAETTVSNNTAVAGQEYDVIGYLYDADGNNIGESEILSLVAPAKNEVLVINSTYTDPEPSVVPAQLSGKIDLNGAVPTNSRIVILQAPINSTNFQVAQDNIPAINDQTWIWTGAQKSSWYSMQAVLKQRQQNGTDIDVAVSEIETVAAPAINVTFKIDSGITPSITPTP